VHRGDDAAFFTPIPVLCLNCENRAVVRVLSQLALQLHALACALDNFTVKSLHPAMRVLPAYAAWMLFVVTACGSAVPVPREQPPAKPVARRTKPPVEHESPPKSDPTTVSPSATAELPHSCSGSRKDCLPPLDFVRRLCKKKYPGVAIVMFNKTAPWQHAFVKVKDVVPFNSLGGPSAHTRLEFLEEVLLLRERELKKQQAEMIMDLPVSYDVLRFDGTCATLADDEFMTRKPYVKTRLAPIIWQQIDGRIRQALAQYSKVEVAVNAQEAACHGTFLAGGEPCRDATQQLARAIRAVLSDGVELPLPSQIPDWTGITTAERQPKSGCPVDQAC
jgi:hypothetical protein